MKRYYEEELPVGYTEALTVDANDKKSGAKLGIAAAIVAAVLFNACFFLYVWPRRGEIAEGFSILKCVGFLAAYFFYVTLHELTHGAVYKLLTGRKLTFGFKPPAAYCGLPDVYVYRKTSLLSLLAPFTVFSVLFAVLFIVVGDPFIKALILALLILHVTGCTGDLHGVGLFLFKFRSPDTLRKDTGPKQIYYTKNRPKENIL